MGKQYRKYVRNTSGVKGKPSVALKNPAFAGLKMKNMVDGDYSAANTSELLPRHLSYYVNQGKSLRKNTKAKKATGHSMGRSSTARGGKQRKSVRKLRRKTASRKNK